MIIIRVELLAACHRLPIVAIGSRRLFSFAIGSHRLNVFAIGSRWLFFFAIGSQWLFFLLLADSSYIFFIFTFIRFRGCKYPKDGSLLIGKLDGVGRFNGLDNSP